jgi:hypothetical protein
MFSLQLRVSRRSLWVTTTFVIRHGAVPLLRTWWVWPAKSIVENQMRAI